MSASMPGVKEVEVHCSHCGWWIRPTTPHDGGSLSPPFLLEDCVRCPQCNDWTNCHEENMRVRYDDASGFVGFEE